MEKISKELENFINRIQPVLMQAQKEVCGKAENIEKNALFDLLQIIIFSEDSQEEDISISRKLSDENVYKIAQNIKGQIDLTEKISRQLLGSQASKDKLDELGEKVDEKLNKLIKRDINTDSFFDVEEIIAFYFIHCLRNSVKGCKILKEKHFINREMENKELEELVEKKHMVIVSGSWDTGRTTFVRQYLRSKKYATILIDGSKQQSLENILKSIEFHEDEFLKNVLPNIASDYCKSEKTNIIKRLENVAEPFYLLIDDYSGTDDFLNELKEFVNSQEKKGCKLNVIVIAGNREFSNHTVLHFLPMDKEALKEVFYKYSETEYSPELDDIVTQESINVLGHIRLMVLIAEEKKYAKEKYHSILDKPQLKIDGHIRNVYENALKNINFGKILLLFCLNSILISEKLMCRLLSINSSTMKQLYENGWCYKQQELVEIRIPGKIALVWAKNENERAKIVSVVRTFLGKLDREIRNVKEDSIDAGMIISILKKSVIPLPSFLEINVKEEKAYKCILKEYYIKYVRYYVEYGYFNEAMDLINEIKDYESEKAVKVWKLIVQLDNSGDVKFLKQLEDDYFKPLFEQSDMDFSNISSEELQAYFDAITSILNTVSLNLMRIENEKLSEKKIHVIEELCLYGPLNVYENYRQRQESILKELEERSDQVFGNQLYYYNMWAFWINYLNYRLGRIKEDEVEDKCKINLQEMRKLLEKTRIRMSEPSRRDKISRCGLLCDYTYLHMLYIVMIKDVCLKERKSIERNAFQRITGNLMSYCIETSEWCKQCSSYLPLLVKLKEKLVEELYYILANDPLEDDQFC